MIDRYSEVVLTVIALSLVSFVLKPWVTVPRANAGFEVSADAIAAQQKELANPTVPRPGVGSLPSSIIRPPRISGCTILNPRMGLSGPDPPRRLSS